MKKLALAAVVAVASSPAFAIVNTPRPSTQVPEISALEGTAALAVLAAVVLLVWERRRRAV